MLLQSCDYSIGSTSNMYVSYTLGNNPGVMGPALRRKPCRQLTLSEFRRYSESIDSYVNEQKKTFSLVY